MLHFADGMPIAMTTTKERTLNIAPGKNIIRGEINVGNLAPGGYHFKFALYCTNEYGGGQLFDGVEHAAHFTIEDTRTVNKMVWNHPKWGHTSLDNIEIHQ